MSTPALGVLYSRCFVGATSYLANINSFAGLRLLLNQNDKALSLLTLGIENERDIPSSSIFATNVNERRGLHYPNGAPWLIPYLFSHHGRAKEQGCLRASLEVSEANQAAIALYEVLKQNTYQKQYWTGLIFLFCYFPYAYALRIV